MRGPPRESALASPQGPLHEPLRSRRKHVVRMASHPGTGPGALPGSGPGAQQHLVHPPGVQRHVKRLPTSLRSRFIGGTYHKVVHGVDPWNQSMFRGTPRGVQIQQDAQRRTPRHWIALDDDLEDWPEAYRHHLIACDGMKGLSDPSVQCELEEQLQRCHSTPFTPG